MPRMMAVSAGFVKRNVQNVQNTEVAAGAAGRRDAAAPGRRFGALATPVRVPRQRTTMSVKSFGYHHMMYCVFLLWSFQVPFAFRFSVGGSSTYSALSDAHAAQ